MTAEFPTEKMKISYEEYDKLPTLKQLHDQGLSGRDLIGRKYRSSHPDRYMIFKKMVRKSENHHQGLVHVTQIWEAEFI
ncbi:hypothetical protein PP940_gp165 [Rhizobium phage RL2RES]|uniref:Uncharacterized protein n=1 Tax=Rhizobium phage RL2RES TaxID=103371 RepID=A0A6B9J1L8_9CAUD|nr:hypothetical protein PP940_gp165 [Rhizobium phage RL2RES]QGZ14309.1 hypothetical protein RL2RES_165 [Rhizobium phage RL2RES]